MSGHAHHDRASHYRANSLSLTGAVAMGTGVMIGSGIFALTGQVAELAGRWFSLAFLAAAVVTAFSAYTDIKLSHAYPSAGGIAMFLEKAYGKSTMTGACALLMYFSMAFVINVLGNRLIQSLSFFFAFLKIAGIAVFAIAGLSVAGVSLPDVTVESSEGSAAGFLGAVALAILSYKGFTTITNCGGEIMDPHRTSDGPSLPPSRSVC